MYTENFDEIEAIAGIKNLVYANGTFRKWQCMKCKFSRILSKTDYEFIAKKAPLKCKRRCRGVLRPCINFTKEKPTDEMIVGLDDDINKADLVLVVGSDMTAPHICVLPYLFKNVPKIYIGEEMPTSFVPTYSILGNCNVICNILQSNDEITPEIEFSYLTERESDLGEHVPVTKKIKDMFNCGLFTSIFQYIMLRKAVSTKALMATNAVSALSQDTYIKSKYIYINKRICLFEHGKAFYIPNMDEKYGFFYCREQLQQLKIIKKVKKNIRYLDTKRKKVNSDKNINEVEEFGEEFAKKMWKILKLDPVDLKENGNVNVPNISPNTTETQSKHLIRNNFKKGKRLLSQVLKSNCHVPSKKICSE
uniref:Deacetylase sirtuin-type domain-containing protein n=1 Tax=Rhabditophanes sp. KR3021 TaxID=114890 RepID=A0AC35TZ59_9BILA